MTMIALGRMSRLVVVFAVVGSAALLAAPGVASRWKDAERQVAIDGRMSEWSELISYEQRVSVAAFNDAQHLYLAIAASDLARRRQLLAAGLIVWLDATGGKKETFGIRIPGAALQLAEGEERPGRGRTRESGGAQRLELLQPDFTYVELLGPGRDDRRRIELSAATGLDAAARVEDGTLLYELKIPVATAAGALRYALVTRGRSLGLGLRTPKIESPGAGQRAGGLGGIGGGMGGGGRRTGRGGGGVGRGGGARTGAMRARDQLDDLKLWTTLTLARLPER
jgi:hypothetical protein